MQPFHLFPLDLSNGRGADLLASVRRQTSPALAALAGRLARAFVVGSPWAPGFCCIGGEVALTADEAQAYAAPRLSLTGNGETPEEALISCLGEAADRLAQAERPGDIQENQSSTAPTNAVTGGWIGQAVTRGPFDWIAAHELATGSAAALPADLCIRRPAGRRVMEPAGALSAGVAAGPDFASATLRAGLELCERDAAALWWLGGRPPRAFVLEHPAAIAGAQLIGKLRQGQTGRRTLLLDISTDLRIPSVAALSLDERGCGLACGLAARLDWEDAARAAILEMCQMELAAPLAEAKRAERGDAALNDIDRRHLERAAFAASECALVHPRGVADVDMSRRGTNDLSGFVARLESLDVRAYAVDLTRPDIGIAVARILSPELQPYSANVTTERLRQCKAANTFADPVPLF